MARDNRLFHKNIFKIDFGNVNIDYHIKPVQNRFSQCHHRLSYENELKIDSPNVNIDYGQWIIDYPIKKMFKIDFGNLNFNYHMKTSSKLTLLVLTSTII